MSGGINVTAISVFVGFVVVSLLITWWAARRTHSARDFYTAGGKITGLQNGLALAGDFMSAATFLGITGLVFIGGGRFHSSFGRRHLYRRENRSDFRYF